MDAGVTVIRWDTPLRCNPTWARMSSAFQMWSYFADDTVTAMKPDESEGGMGR